jgi:hypothetical protein
VNDQLPQALKMPRLERQSVGTRRLAPCSTRTPVGRPSPAVEPLLKSTDSAVKAAAIRPRVCSA